MSRLRAVCLFCGSADGADPRYRALAEAFGRQIAQAGLKLVYGGGDVGLMGAAARAAVDAGGRVLGVIPECLMRAEIVCDAAEVIVVRTLHDRKRLMAEHADAFAVLPGGVGTLEEAVEILSWARIGLHEKPTVFIDDDGYWNAFFELIEQQIERGFTPAAMRAHMRRARSPREAIAALSAMAARAA